MDSRLVELTRLVEWARRRGAWGVEALYERAEGTRMRSRRSRIAEEEPFATAELTVRCWLEGGRGAAAHGDPEQATALVEQALEQAEGAEADPLAGPEDRLEPPLGGLGIDDRRFASLGRDDRADVLTSAERSVRQTDRRLSARDFCYEDQRRQRTFVSSRGVALEEFDTRYVLAGAVLGSAAGDEIRLEHGVEARSFSTIASLPLGAALAQRAGALLLRGEQLDGEVLVMMPPHVTAKLFARLAEGFVQPGDFFLSPRADVVLDERVHVFDDGGLPGGLRAASFDDRGCPPLPVTLIRAGRPEGRYLDVRGARALDHRPTGHWWGGSLRPSNLILRSGTRSMNALFNDRNAWSLLLDDLDPGAIDLRTGRLDAVVNAVVMHANEPRGAMRGVRLEGDLAQVLGGIEDLASDTDRHGHVDAPGMLLRGLTVTRA